jgi:hypothetical protein
MMNGEAIFLPMLLTMALTAVVWHYMYARRIPAMRRAGKRAQTYTTPDKTVEHLSDEVNYAAYNLKNLFEVPILYYGLCLYLFVSGNVDTAYVVAAWLFFVFRTLHSIVHCTRNVVILRFGLYSAAALVLWFMLGRALIGQLPAYF